MRHFSSYGPVDPELHFCVPRTELVEQCVDQLVGHLEKGGHYFTVWAPRQTGKTWLLRRAMEEIRARYGDTFLVGAMSMQGVYMDDDEPDTGFLRRVPGLFWRGLGVRVEEPSTWESVQRLFQSEAGILTRPVILLIDEFDSLPRTVIDRLVTMFRDIYLDRGHHLLHGVALVGVRAVLGVESDRGSPFNVQRSLHVPNLTRAEVGDLFDQYQAESGQEVDQAVVDALFQATRGQPGLVSWFGELLTEKYNPGIPAPITTEVWEDTYVSALTVEWNNTVLNLVAKARKEPYREQVLRLFSESDVAFSLDVEWCNYLYLNGIIDFETLREKSARKRHVCRFSSPFVQARIYNALTGDLVGERLPVHALDPRDALEDVFTPDGVDLARLLRRYRDYLKRLRTAGLDPWKEQPRRKDLRLTEAVAHFHLYAWLMEALDRACNISPEFPTGNGKVDLVVRWEGKISVLEVKSFTRLRDLPGFRAQAARYARSLGLDKAVLALFVPLSDDDPFLETLSTVEPFDDVQVVTVAIGWG